MKKETENKQQSFSFKKGHTLPMSDENLNFLENCQKALLIGNLRGMIVDNNDDGKPSFFQTANICDKKAKMALTFYKRFSDVNKFTHFLVHEDDLQYYKDFIENFALETGQVFTHRLRGKSTEYKIAFIPPIVDLNAKSSINIGDEYRKDLETLSSFAVGSEEQDKQIKYMLQKYVAICLNYTDGKLNEVYTDHGNITVIVYKDNKMFTNVYYKVNKLTGEKIEIRDFDNVPKMFNDRINRFKGKKTMTYDFILMNPPYNVGNKITSSTINTLCGGKCVCLMPLSQYKSNELYRHVEDLRLADSDMFEDADITNNLCICTLQKSVVDKYRSYEDIAMESYDPRFRAFYEVNSKLPLLYVFKRCDNSKIGDFDLNVDIIEGGRLMDSDTGISGPGGMGYKINVLKQYNTKLNSCLTKITCSNSTVKANLIKFLYGTDKCWNKVMFGMNLKTTAYQASIAIPQIDWETISDTHLWKEGKYDEAVLDVMGLKWNDDKSGIVMSN